MRIHSIEKIKELKRLRKKGFSINELVTKLSIPKTTVWHHIHDVKVSQKYILILKGKRGGGAKRKRINLEKARKYAQKLLQSSARELSIIIAMLYWGEGSKKRCEFINFDGRIIETYLIVLRDIFNIQEEFIKPTMRIYSGMNRKECLNYWSRITKIPRHKFIIRFNDGGTKGRTKYGMCRITVKKGGNVLKLIQLLIDQVFENIIKKY
jgi:hypothetical protein